MQTRKCCFIGHRQIKITEDLVSKIESYIENLILEKKVKIFLFGSRSEFNFLCYQIVSKLMERFKNIKRIFYGCKSESVFLERDREKWIKIINNDKILNKIMFVEGECEFKNKYKAGKASYIERDYSMIDDSDYCLFYYNPNYKPNKRKPFKNSTYFYQPKSGTSLSYAYALKQNKICINFFDNTLFDLVKTK